VKSSHRTIGFDWIGYRAPTFATWQNVHYQYRNGLYDEEEFRVARVGLKVRLSRPGVAAMWCDTEEQYSREFVAEVERLLPPGSSCAKGAEPR
jgi:hypothetical protein